ncbi:MAG: flagellin [Nitriliruptoraceae bacterium]
MRITSDMLATRSLDRLQSRLKAYERSQSELSSGKRIMAPSDDPGGARRGMTLRAAMRAREQELRNIEDAIGWLNNADTQLQAASDRTRRARDLTVDGATLKDPGAHQAIATELREIADELVGIANTSHSGRPLFGGFAAGDAVTEVAGGTLDFDPPAGQADEVVRRVSDTEQVRVNTTAAEWLGADAPPDADGDSGDLVTQLRKLADRIEAGDQDAASAGLATLDTAIDRITGTLADIGATTNRVDSAKLRANDGLLTLRTELSNVEDIDVADGIMELQIQEVGYQATLQALAKALPPSLGSFLR